MTVILKIRTLLSIVVLLFISFTSISQANPKLVEEIRKIEKQFELDLIKMGAEYAFESMLPQTQLSKDKMIH